MIFKIFRHSENSWSIGLLTGCVFLLIFDLVFHLNIIRQPVEQMTRLVLPLHQLMQESIQKPVVWAEFVRSGSNQIANYERTQAELKVQLSELETLQLENVQLRSTLEKGVRPQSSTQFQIVAGVLKGGAQWAIDKGDHDGVKAGDLVFAHGVFVGLVDTVTPLFATLNLFHMGETQLVAVTSKQSTGVVQFDQGQLWLKYVNIDQPLEVGDTVRTAGSLEPFIPSELYIGEVTEIVKDTQSSVMQARLDQTIDLRNISVVVIQRQAKN